MRTPASTTIAMATTRPPATRTIDAGSGDRIRQRRECPRSIHATASPART
jgi:hypothetical protein